MASKFREKMVFFLFWPALLVCLVTSCVSTGSSNLSLRNAEKIIGGETTKGEISEVLGKPEKILNLDKEGLASYLSRVAIGGSPQLDLGEDLYEVWIYNRWNQAAGLVFTPSYEEAEVCILVIDGKGVCVERFYAKEGSLRF